MSRVRFSRVLTLTIVCCLVPALGADDPATKFLKQGDACGVFYVTKIAGAEDDGVEPGQDLCYRCRYGSSPMVMVFMRDIDGKVAELARRIDAAVEQNQEARLKGMLTLLGDDTVQLRELAGKIAAQAEIRRVPVVVAKDRKTGPLNYRLPADADITIVIAKDSQVVNTHVYSADRIDIAAVMSEVKNMLR